MGRVSAGGNILIAAQPVTRHSLVGDRNHRVATDTTTNHGALVAAGGDLGMFAAGSVSVLAGQNGQQTTVARRSSGFGLFGTSDGVDLY